MSLNVAIEHAEHIAHAGHEGHGETHGNQHGKGDNFGTHIGMTIAGLGVLLAICSAKVGAERTELVHTLVEQQSANSKYNAQDVKHRVAFLSLSSIHAQIYSPTPSVPNKEDIIYMADTVDRYLGESHAAKEWTESYDAQIGAHVEAQEHYEIAQLLAEMGIVIASVAMLIKKRIAWFISLGIGLCSIGFGIKTYIHTSDTVHASEDKITTTAKAYRDLRNKNKTTNYEHDLVKQIKTWAGVTVSTPTESKK